MFNEKKGSTPTPINNNARNKKLVWGFTLVEVIMVIAIIAIIALATSAIIMFFMRNSIFLPNQINVQQIADAAMDLMIEGDDKPGLRFSRRITEAATNRIQFLNSNGQNVKYEILDSVIKRKIDAEPDEAIPYYATGNITVSGEGNILFRYYDQNEAAAASAADVRRIEIKMIAQSGTGSVDDWEGKMVLASSVKVYKSNQSPFFTSEPPVTANPSSIPRRGTSTITFSVDDPDGGTVGWTATATRGRLDLTSGSSAVPYNIALTYTAGNRTGTGTVTVNLDDGSGGTASGSTTVQIY